MIVDTSAVVAIIRQEPVAAALTEALLTGRPHLMSAATRVELGIVVARELSEGEIDEVLTTLGITVEPVSVDQARLAAQTHRRFGRGNHPAKLNFGDTFSYALARSTGQPLLCTGNDFAQTDVELALAV